MAETAPRRRKAPVTKTITVPGNFRQAVHEFNTHRFFECHESLEEVWQQEQGEVRDLYKGLIQVAAAWVHVRRNNEFGVRRLLTTALGYLAPYRPEGAMGFNVEEICVAAEAALAEAARLGKDHVEELYPEFVPVYRLDETAIPAEARRWAAWGFDSDGNELEMEITVIE
ncbi:MAG: DUF309 domain-containing protein [Hyphomicrobiales bacterium]